MFKFNVLLVFWCAVMIMQPWMGEGLRVKRSHVPAPAVDALTAKAVASTLATAVTSQATSSGTAAGTAAGTAKAVATGANTTNPPAAVTAGPTVATATDTATNTTESSLGPRLVGDLLSALQHARRRLSLLNDELTARSSRNKRSHASTGVPPGTAPRSAPLTLQPLGLLSLMNNAPIARRHHESPGTASSAALSPPFGGYYSKTILPDGNTEMEEFQLVSPNLMTEMTDNGVQQATLLGPIMPPSKYHQQFKSSPALPPMLDMFQQLLQSNPVMEQSPLFQFINRAEDLTMQNIPRVIEHILGDGLGLEIDGQLDGDTDAKDNEDKDNEDKDKQDGKSKLLDASKKDELKNGSPSHEENEIVISCPVRHEQHANRNGQMVDDDIVLVDQCHVV